MKCNMFTITTILLISHEVSEPWRLPASLQKTVFKAFTCLSEQRFPMVTLAFGVGARLLAGRGLAVIRLQGHGVLMMMMPPAVSRSAAGVVARLSPPLSLCQQTGSFPPGKVSQLLPVLTVQLKPG